MKAFPTFKLFAVFQAAVLLSLASAFSFADSRISEHFSRYVENSDISVDHDDWSQLLGSYVESRDGINFFRYAEVSEADRQSLEQYIGALASVTVTDMNQAEQYSYWVNLYNAITVQVILDHYPVDSIRDISFGLLTRGPWKEKFAVVEGFELSLDDIEHVILRPVFYDNRVHYAVNCASIGCPNLQTSAFTADGLDEMLDAAAEQYINHPRGVSVVDDELVVSSIFDWYAGDFGESQREIIRHMMKYAAAPLAERLRGFDAIDGYRYDWSLNELGK